MPGHRRPALVVEGVAALEDHPVDRRRAAEDLAPGVVDAPAVHERLGLGSVAPVVERAADRERQRGRHVQEDVEPPVRAGRPPARARASRDPRDSRFASTQPADPPPTITTSNRSSIERRSLATAQSAAGCELLRRGGIGPRTVRRCRPGPSASAVEAVGELARAAVGVVEAERRGERSAVAELGHRRAMSSRIVGSAGLLKSSIWWPSIRRAGSSAMLGELGADLEEAALVVDDRPGLGSRLEVGADGRRCRSPRSGTRTRRSGRRRGGRALPARSRPPPGSGRAARAGARRSSRGSARHVKAACAKSRNSRSRDGNAWSFTSTA